MRRDGARSADVDQVFCDRDAQRATQARSEGTPGASTYHPGFSASGQGPDSGVMIWRRRRPFQERLCPPSFQKMRGCRHRGRVDAGARTVGGQWRERAAPPAGRARTGRLGLAASRRDRQLARRQKTYTSAQRISRPNSGGSRAEPWPVGARGRHGVPSSNPGEPRRASREERVGVAGRRVRRLCARPGASARGDKAATATSTATATARPEALCWRPPAPLWGADAGPPRRPVVVQCEIYTHC